MNIHKGNRRCSCIFIRTARSHQGQPGGWGQIYRGVLDLGLAMRLGGRQAEDAGPHWIMDKEENSRTKTQPLMHEEQAVVVRSEKDSMSQYLGTD